MGTVSSIELTNIFIFISVFFLFKEKGKNQFRKTFCPFEKQEGSSNKTTTTKIGSTKGSQRKRSEYLHTKSP